MKKKVWISILIIGVLAIFFLPIPTGVYKDGGTREYTALTYKIVNWNRINSGVIYDKIQIYFFPDNFKSIDDLWDYEKDKIEYSFNATILSISEDFVFVKPYDNEIENKVADQITFNTSNLPDIKVKSGDCVNVVYTGIIMESYPSQINAIKWKKIKNQKDDEYKDQWIEKTDENKSEEKNRTFLDLNITGIYSNCFFAKSNDIIPYRIKINGKLSDEWCIGDRVTCTCENIFYDEENKKYEADFLDIKPSEKITNYVTLYKPVIYLYPEKETEVSVKLNLDGEFTCTYPEYKDGWKVTASPDGTLTDEKGQTYNYLYWEGDSYANFDLSKGFCVKGKDTAKFLENTLQKLGLNRKEANEFIIYWLPLMQDNPYNIISFQTDIYTDSAKLNISPSPDTLIRVFMAWKSVENHVELPKQQLFSPERKGFTVIEWGGTEIK